MQDEQNNRRSETGERMKKARQERLETFPGAFSRRAETGTRPSALREKLAAQRAEAAEQIKPAAYTDRPAKPAAAVTGREADEKAAAKARRLKPKKETPPVTGREADELREKKERAKAEKQALAERKQLEKQLRAEEKKLKKQEAKSDREASKLIKQEVREQEEFARQERLMAETAERLEAKELREAEKAEKLMQRETEKAEKRARREAEKAEKLMQREEEKAERRELREAAKADKAALRGDAKERIREVKAKRRELRREQREKQRIEDIESGAAAKRRNAVFIVLAILMVAGFFVFVYFYATVDTISVRGANRFTPEEIINYSGLYTGKNIFLYDLDEAKANIEKNTYIRVRDISRLFPKELLIEVSERGEFAALIGSGGSASVIDREGVVLDVGRKSGTEDLVQVLGMVTMGQSVGVAIDADKTALRPFVLMEIIRAIGDRSDEILSIDVSNTASLRIVTKSGATVMLGDSVDVREKVGYMFGALSKLDAVAPGTVIYIHSNGTADISHPTQQPAETPAPTEEISETDEPADTAEPGDTDEPADTDEPDDTGDNGGDQ